MVESNIAKFEIHLKAIEEYRKATLSPWDTWSLADCRCHFTKWKPLLSKEFTTRHFLIYVQSTGGSETIRNLWKSSHLILRYISHLDYPIYWISCLRVNVSVITVWITSLGFVWYFNNLIMNQVNIVPPLASTCIFIEKIGVCLMIKHMWKYCTFTVYRADGLEEHEALFFFNVFLSNVSLIIKPCCTFPNGQVQKRNISVHKPSHFQIAEIWIHVNSERQSLGALINLRAKCTVDSPTALKR